MTNQLEAARRVVSDVMTTTLSAPWTRDGELECQSKAIARQLERIHSSRDAELTLRRVLSSSFGDSAFPEQELVFAGRLLWLRLRAEGLVDAMPDVEGYSADEILEFVTTDLREIVFSGSPIVFRVGSAQVLATFRLSPDQMVAELAHIDGGGEGVLLFLSRLVRQFGAQNRIASVLWIVHALTCAAPNLRLRALLERRGFIAVDHNGRPTLQLTEAVDAG
jgi:hypothetical protein